MQGGRAYARAWVSHGVMVVLQWLPGHYTIGARRYMAGGHGSMMWVHLWRGTVMWQTKSTYLQVLGDI